MDFCELLVPEEGELDATEVGPGGKASRAVPRLLPPGSIHNAIWRLTRSRCATAVELPYLRRCVEIAAAAGAKIIGGPTLRFASRLCRPRA